ncbi:ABC transporter permease [Marinilabilia salmonicolor]|uniref:ABC transporter permease n=1 Tax=Marinilabilia salmonicolor TaxID=989 RepID=UPI000299F5B3|nr:ABC transporter permease [Marinilabilia salmonicolor]
MQKKKEKINSFELTARHLLQELKSIYSDSGALLILVGAMIIYPVVYSIGYSNEVLTDLPVGVVDLDQSSLSRKYISMLDGTRDVAVTMEPASLKEAEELFLSNKITGVILIPQNFEKDILQERPTNVAIYADGSYFLKYKTQYMAASYVNAYFSGGISIKRYIGEGQSFRQAGISNNPLDIQTHLLYNPSSSYGSFIMPGLIILIIQQTLLIGIGIMGGSFSESKKSLFFLPKNKRIKEILPLVFGKAGAYLAISMINIGLAVVLIHDWFSFPDKANMTDMMMLLFPFLMAVIFLGIGLSTLFKHRESSIVFMMFLSPIALFVSGISWPVSAMPQWLVELSKIFPGTTAIPAYLRLRIMGTGLTDVKNELLFLYGQAALYGVLTIGYYIFRIRKNSVTKNNYQLRE